MKLEEFVKYQF